MIRITNRHVLLSVTLAFSCVLLPQIALAYLQAPSNTRNINGPIHVNAGDKDWVTHVLPTGRIVSPVGTVNGAPNFVTEAVPFGQQLAVLANGATYAQTITWYDQHSLQRLAEMAAYKKAARTLPEPTDVKDLHGNVIGHQSFFQGLAVGPQQTLYAAGGASGDVAAFRLVHGKPQLLQRYPLVWQDFPKTQYPYEYQGHYNDHSRLFYPDAIAVGPKGQHLYVTGMLSNSLARINIQSGNTRYLNVGPYPFADTFADDGKRLVVSLWGGNAVAVVDPDKMRLLGDIRVGPPTGPQNTAAGVHPTALAAVPHSADVFVALANIDRIAEVNTADLRVKGFLNDSPYPDAPPGTYPDGLTIVGTHLFVANAGNNDVAVFDDQTGKALGLIPTAWYPTAITHTASDLYVVSAKGLGSGPNVEHQWVGDMMDGTVQKIKLSDLNEKLPAWTEQSLKNDGFTAAQQKSREAIDAKTTRFLRKHIHYVVFILRENKTFDEDLGDYKPAGAWADPQLDLYGPKELPNLYNLAKHYTLFVNFMADGEVTAQGHQWTTAASDSDFVQRTWPEYYSGRGLVANPGWTQSLVPGGATGTGGIPLGVDNPYAIYENLSVLGKWSNPWISYPQRLFLFNDLLNHHVSFEDFGEFVSRSEAGNISPAMKKHLATGFPGWDRMFLDTYREKMAENWLKAHPGAQFPHFIYIWLPDDHTAGREPCYYTPNYYVANNDFATAKFIHYLSTTPQWKHMVVFLTEDDAQSGADHINAHRTFALAMGPWVKRGYLQSNLYSQVNILKTTEAVFGLPPMSQWDQNASVFAGIWTRHPDFTPTPKVIPMQIPLAFNAGKCSHYTLLRREAGAAGHYLHPDSKWYAWYKAHQSDHGAGLPPPGVDNTYTPTTLLKVPGPEQMKQEWIAAKGVKAWHKEMHYLKAYAAKQHAPLAAYQAGEKE
ncbi:quinoprotein amine dehydrogenase, beta chain-like protein [Acidithiobacillus thiooxidans]|uniref:bifunctional YncE family protein/alkaline phosphatase family protein n=1 Tax=Acidithiobacillus thiooxidans TaxID=930 RepID=UPI001C07EC77|nr:quinoprotein amine dehydrogenase, beta chain-like protein [Acidithiobacillus thiooxidans]MDA8154286.1 quinoprotein amine dehydrogenase, beta chain-like protein [Acidithiobacillus sp.]